MNGWRVAVLIAGILIVAALFSVAWFRDLGMMP
jgi:hypothetical protein